MADTLRDLITNGAYAAASVVDDDYSLEELVDAGLSDKEAKKRRIKERSANFQARRAERAGNQQNAEDFLAEDSRRFESIGSFVEQERYPDPFGIPVSGADPDSGFGEISERGVSPAERQRGGYVNVDRGRGRERMWRERGQLVSEPKFAKNKLPDFSDPFVETPTAPQAAGIGGPNGLATQLADMVARGEVDPSALVPGSSTKTIDTLIREMAMEADPQLQRDADRNVGRETAKRDAARISPAARAVSDAKAGREADRFKVDTEARQNLAAIENIQSLGLASKKFNRGVPMEQFNVVPGVDPNTFDDAIEMLGPDGATVGYADNQDRFIADVNMPGPDNISNAPVSRTATWIEGNLPSFGQEGGTSFGARQVNAGNELSMLNQRLGNFGLATGIRGIDDLEQVVRAVTVDAAFRGKSMFNYDPEQGKAVAIRDPGIDEVLYGLGYTADEKVRLASALQNVEAAMRSPVNSLAKELYAAGIPSESQDETIRGFEKDVQLSRITDERVGRDNKKTGEKRISIRKGLKALDASPEQVFKNRDPSTIYAITPNGQSILLPDAQQDLIDARLAQSDAPKPFQAAIEGEQRDTKYRKDPERARFIKNTERNPKVFKMTDEARIEAFGPAGGEVANEIIRRTKEDEQLRTAPKPQDAIADEFRARDSEFEAAGEVRNAADERAVKMASKPSGVRATGQTLLGGQEVPRMKIYDDPQYASSDGFSMPTRDPVVAQKAAPMQKPLAGITYNETAPDPWMQPIGTGNGISNEINKRRATQSNVPLLSASPPSKEYTFGSNIKPDGPSVNSRRVRQENDYRQAVRNLGRVRGYGRNAAIAGGAVAGLAGLDALIGGERDNRDQEVYQ